MGVRIKVIIGYCVLIALLAFIVYLFRQEQVKHNTLQKEEKELIHTRKLTEQVLVCLLDLTSQAELVSVWKGTELEHYRTNRAGICDTLQVLRDYVHTTTQQARIDSLCMLLQEKGTLLSAVMRTFTALQDIGNLVSEKIPEIVSKARQGSMLQDTTTYQSLLFKEPKEKKGFWSIFHRKETKSAYLKQKEQDVRKNTRTATSSLPSTTRLLYSLNREVAEKQHTQQQILLVQMDSLYHNNMVLNGKLNSLIQDFETEANLLYSDRYKTFVADREESFLAITELAALIFLLVILIYIVIHREINRRSNYEKELEISDRKNKDLLQSRKKMMLSIAHDLRSPLAIIKESSELLPRLEEKAKCDEFAMNIHHSSDYMLSLVNTLMEFYMLDTEQIRLRPVFFLLSAFFKETVQNYTLLSKKRHIRFTTHFSGLDVIVNGDRAHLQQIINNLLSNALKFTDKGLITLDAEYKNGELCFLVRDSGTGMTEEEKKRIFNAFERLENARNTPGFGLGLAITSKLVKRMNGEISVESHPERGSTFSVFLPLPAADDNSDLQEIKPATICQLENVRVLVIDDDRIQQKITCEMFSQNGVMCDCCANSWELTDLLKRNDYDLLLTDIQMPEVDGFDILEMLRSSNMGKAKSIPVIAVTARPEDDNEYLSKGFSGSIHKPFTSEQLMEVTRKTVGQKESKSPEPDFSVILSGEDDEREMLRLFIEETRRDLKTLVAAIERSDLKTIHSVLHKNLPLWETVRLNYPTGKIRELVVAGVNRWTREQIQKIQEIIPSVEGLINFAEHKLQEENK